MYKKNFPFAVLFISIFILCGCKSRIALSSSSIISSITESTVEVYDFTYTLNDGVATITGLTNYNINTLAVPSTIEGYPVGAISLGAFIDCRNLVSLTIPFVGETKDGSTNTHFSYIFGSGNVSFNSSYVPSSLKSVIITDGTSIGDYAFSRCSGITTITIPDSVTSIGEMAFFRCSSLTSITIPDSVKSIDSDVFSYCSGLKSITIGSGVESISINAFDSCSGLEYISVDLNNMIYKSEDNCLIEKSTNTLILGCKNSVIPNYVESIGSSAFMDCSGLKSITIPDSVKSIGSSAFKGCIGLTSITIPFVGETLNGKSNMHFGYIFGAESYSNNSSSVPSNLKSVIITDGNSIGPYAFYKCSGLTSITIPDSIESIGPYAFSHCSNLTSITIPDNVTSIGSDAFSYCSSLTSIIIPDSVESIGSYAFYNCTDLTSIIIGSGVENIDSYTFYYCSSLTSITIPDSVKNIGSHAFSCCSFLTSVYYEGNITSWNSISISSYNTELTSATIYYYSEIAPTTSGNYWHYVGGLITEWPAV